MATSPAAEAASEIVLNAAALTRDARVHAVLLMGCSEVSK